MAKSKSHVLGSFSFASLAEDPSWLGITEQQVTHCPIGESCRNLFEHSTCMSCLLLYSLCFHSTTVQGRVQVVPPLCWTIANNCIFPARRPPFRVEVNVYRARMTWGKPCAAEQTLPYRDLVQQHQVAILSQTKYLGDWLV